MDVARLASLCGTLHFCEEGLEYLPKFSGYGLVVLRLQRLLVCV